MGAGVSAALLLMGGCKPRVPKAEAVSSAAAQAADVSVEKSVVEVQRPAFEQVAVLGYHRFVSRVRHPDTEVTPEMFEQQLDQLRDAGATVVGLRDFMEWKQGRKSIAERSVLITIDDGYRSVYEVAWPILRKRGYPFTLFVYTDYIRGGKRSGGESLSWEELAEMRDAGVEIQSHTVSHRDLRGGRGMGAGYEEWLRNELVGSKSEIERRLGVRVDALALPYGASNERVRAAALEAGYEVVFTVNGQRVVKSTPADATGRFMVMANRPQVVASAFQFPAVESHAVAAAALRTPMPAEGAELEKAPERIEAGLDTFGAVDPASVTVRLSGAGPLTVEFDPVRKRVSARVPEGLKAGRYAAIIAATADGRRMEASWEFVVKEQPKTAPAESEGKGGGGSAAAVGAVGAGR